ncbi:serine hydrolase domain-containing protein [Chryseobacterium sp. RLHN22]|uniref:serine hydrolase domain-containing protein n=1 Tax=Chryseobacterium sp. RLHN22 TaxID=3437885 RepID=UPI003D9B5B89
MKTLFTFVFSMLISLFFPQKVTQIKHLDGKSVSSEVLQKRLQQIVDSANLAGLQVAIVNKNKIVWSSSFGYKDVENQQKLDDNTAMYAASLTKPISAYMFLRLVDKGIFDLDKPIHYYLKKPIKEYPKWKDLNENIESFNLITPRMLLSHSAGLPVLRQLYDNKVLFLAKPGEKYYYSNEGINLLGFVVEEYTGKTLQTIAVEEVFVPLKMTATSMIWERKFENNFSNGYFSDGKKYGSERRETARAAGSMTTTAIDYSRFIIQLMKRKGLKENTMNQMLSPQIAVKSKRGFGPLKDTFTNDNDEIKLSWGLGVGLFQSSYGPGFFHTGHGDANQNFALGFPDKEIAVVLMSNSENFEHVSKQILETCVGKSNVPLKWLGHSD